MENMPSFPNPMDNLSGRPFGELVGPLAYEMFYKAHMVWTKEEIDLQWNDPRYALQRQYYLFLARIAIDHLMPILTGQ